MNYRMSFTNGGLFFRESLVLAELYQSLGSWAKVKPLALEKNLLQSRTVSSAKRNIREICSRLECLTQEQLDLLMDGSRSDQASMLWLAVCKRYQFVKEFAEEVIREKFLRLDNELSYADYDFFFNAKAEWHEELAGLSETTNKKLRQVLFRLLREADILSANDMILPAMLSPHIVWVIIRDNPAYLTIFPASDLDIQEWSR